MKIYKGYAVYEDGTVFDKLGKLRNWTKNIKGYKTGAIKSDGKWITITHHKFVAEAYYGQRPSGMEVGHKNDIRDDNRPCNLEYVTKSQNNQQSYDNGNRSAVGTNNANCIITEDQVKLVCQSLSENPKLNISKLSRDTGISRITVSNIKHRRQWNSISCNYIF